MHFESGMRNMIHMENGIMSGDKANSSIVLQTIIKHTYIHTLHMSTEVVLVVI